MKRFVMVMVIIFFLSGFAFAAPLTDGASIIRSAGYSLGYEVQVPNSIDEMLTQENEGTWLCGDTNVPVRYQDTSYYIQKKVSGITSWNIQQVDVFDVKGYGIEREISLSDNMIKVFLGSQSCYENYTYTCYESGCECEVIPGLICDEVFINQDLIGKKVRIRIPVDR